MTEENQQPGNKGMEIKGTAKMMNVEVVIRRADGTIRERRLETVKMEEGKENANTTE
jgi:hypothetical protein